MTTRTTDAVVACAVLSIAAGPGLRADPVTLTPVQDNSIYSESLNAAGAFEHIFAGRTSQGDLRRALLSFDLSAIPAGSTIDDVMLRLTLTASAPTAGTRDMTLHRLQAAWGEGTSSPTLPGGTGAPPTPDSATWQHRFYDETFWTTPGGDFVAAPSASAQVPAFGTGEWTSSGLVADVQGWLDDPSANFGWILIGDEAVPGTAKRFASREAATASQRPTLTVHFTPPVTCYPDCDENGELNVADFLCFIDRFAIQDPYADCNGDGLFNVSDFLCFIDEFAIGCP